MRCPICRAPTSSAPCLRCAKDMPEVVHTDSPYSRVTVDGRTYTGFVGRMGSDTLLRVRGPHGAERPHGRTYSFGQSKWLGGPLKDARFWMAAGRLLEEALTRRQVAS